MPLDKSYTPPVEQARNLVPENYYNAVIEDIGYSETEDGFHPGQMRKQFEVKFKITDEGKAKGASIMIWIDDSLLPQTKKQRPVLPDFLEILTGQKFTLADRPKLTSDMLNSFIGQAIRIQVIKDKNAQGLERNKITRISKVEV